MVLLQRAERQYSEREQTRGAQRGEVSVAIERRRDDRAKARGCDRAKARGCERGGGTARRAAVAIHCVSTLPLLHREPGLRAPLSLQLAERCIPMTRQRAPGARYGLRVSN